MKIMVITSSPNIEGLLKVVVKLQKKELKKEMAKL
jgi:hypothetical protein